MPRPLSPPAASTRSVPLRANHPPVSDANFPTVPSVNALNMYDPTSPAYQRASPSDINAGRTQLHRLLDEVLDKADTTEVYNPDSLAERQRQYQQRNRITPGMYEQRNPPSIDGNPSTRHEPMFATVSQRPDSALLQTRLNPYEAGDRAYEVERLTAVELKPKYDSDQTAAGPRYSPASFHSNPRLYYDSSHPNEQRHHRFHNGTVYVDTIPKNRDGLRAPIREAWTPTNGNAQDNYFHINPSDLNADPAQRNDYRDEYIMAKRSVVSTKNLISSIHDELQNIITDAPSENYQA